MHVFCPVTVFAIGLCGFSLFTYVKCLMCRSQWALRLRLGSAADRFLGLRVRIPLGAGMSVFCEVSCVVG
jgi:hypothetical protein